MEACQQYAAAKGWTVVGTYTDDGVSASRNKPEDRQGWQALVESPVPYDHVVIWKIDRLARRVSDFMRAQWALEEHDAGIASVTEGLDMTTTLGQMVATMLAYFAQMEAEAIAARVAGARTHLLRSGRAVGGAVPYGWQNVPNPDGPGKVLAQHPERIDVVRGIVQQIQRGNTIYGVSQWLSEQGIPSPTGGSQWAHTTVERILRHPILAGMIPFNPGQAQANRKRPKNKNVRGSGVLPGDDGLPLVHDHLAVMSVQDWRAMVQALDDRDSPQAAPLNTKTKSSGVLSGLIMCGAAGTTSPYVCGGSRSKGGRDIHAQNVITPSPTSKTSSSRVSWK